MCVCVTRERERERKAPAGRTQPPKPKDEGDKELADAGEGCTLECVFFFCCCILIYCARIYKGCEIFYYFNYFVINKRDYFFFNTSSNL